MTRRTHVLMTATAAMTLAGLAAPALAIQPASTPLGAAGGVRYMKASILLEGDKFSPPSAGTAAFCDDGWDAVSGGQTIGTQPGQGIADSWIGQDKYWYSGAWHYSDVETRLTTYAICMKSPQISASKVIADNLPASSAVTRDVFCAEGAAMSGSVLKTGDAHDFALNASFPIDSAADEDTVPDDGWRSYVDYTGDGGDSVHFGVSCLKDTTLVYRSKTVSVPAGTALSTKAVCPDDTPAVGGGVNVQGSANMAHVVASRPWDSKDDKTVPEDGWRAGVLNTSQVKLSMTVHAVCRGTAEL